MIISFKHKFAFIHNPKVGGTSIRKSIEDYHDQGFPYWHQDWNGTRVQDMAHIPREDISDGLRAWMKRDDVFVFGFVRNPLFRFWSSLAEFRRQHADWFPAKMEVNEFIRTFLTEANTRYDWRFVHFCPQHYFFCEHGKIVADFVGRHESFAFDWDEVKTILQARGLKIPALKNERHRVAADNEELNPESLEILHRLYDFDCRTFNYAPIVADPNADTHEYRVSQIHDPRVRYSSKLYSSLTDGERIAYNKKVLRK